MKRDEDEAEREDGPDTDALEGEGEAGDRDASTQSVAEALGVDEDEAAAAAAAEEATAAEESGATNRTSRRREQALERRKKKSSKAKPKRAEVAEDDGEPVEASEATADLPKDKNARAKELLKRRQQSAASMRRGPSGLDTGELVQDAFARGSSAAGRWFVANAQFVIGGAVLLVLGVSGLIFFRSQEEAKAGEATGALSEALAADRGRVLKEDKRTDEEKELDPTRVFSTSEARADAALAGYEKALGEASEPGPTTLARLGVAGAKLEKGDAQGAIDAYTAVLATPLAGADADVRGRALEGTALAQESKGDLDAALKSFEELAKIDAKGFEELGLYHQARVLVQKGDKEQAKTLLKKAREKLSAPSESSQAFPFLEAVVDGQLRSLDPSAVPARTQMMGGAKGNSMTPEDLERIQEQFRKAMEKKAAESEEHEGEQPGGMPSMPNQEQPQ